MINPPLERLNPLTYDAIKYHTDRLRDLGLIDRSRPGRCYRHEPTHVLTIWEHDIGTNYAPSWEPT